MEEIKKIGTVTYLTTSPNMLMRYALVYSPERLWHGPLGFAYKPIVFPMKIGESKKEYMMRIIESRITEKNEEERPEILKAAEIVCEAFGTKRPRIAIIPESAIKDYKANYCGISREDDCSISELAKVENPEWIYNLSSGPNFGYEGGISVFGKVTPDMFTTISIPDFFELAQIYAIQRGAELGDMVYPLTGKIAQKSAKQDLVPTTIVHRMINIFKGKIIGHKKVNSQETKKSKREYQDLRINKPRWYWGNAFMQK